MDLAGQGLKFEGQTKPDAISVDSYEPDLFAKRTTDIPNNLQKRLDYVARTDSQPVYIGYAPRTLPTSTTGWILYYVQYDGSNRVTTLTVAYDSWDRRTLATYG